MNKKQLQESLKDVPDDAKIYMVFRDHEGYDDEMDDEFRITKYFDEKTLEPIYTLKEFTRIPRGYLSESDVEDAKKCISLRNTIDEKHLKFGWIIRNFNNNRFILEAKIKVKGTVWYNCGILPDNKIKIMGTDREFDNINLLIESVQNVIKSELKNMKKFIEKSLDSLD